VNDDFNIDDLRRSNANSTPPEFSDVPTVVIPTVEYQTVPQSASNGRGCLAFILLVLTAILFFFCGRGCKPTELPDRQPAPAVTVTKTITVTVTAPSVPQDCIDALDTALKMVPLMNSVNTQSSQVTDIISRARVAIVEKDHQGLIRAGNELHAALSKTRTATNEFMELQNAYDSKVKVCNTALGR